MMFEDEGSRQHLVAEVKRLQQERDAYHDRYHETYDKFVIAHMRVTQLETALRDLVTLIEELDLFPTTLAAIRRDLLAADDRNEL